MPATAFLDGAPLRGRSVLVTGATGFIGGRLAARLAAEEGARVTGTGRRVDRAAEAAGAGVELVAADLRDSARMAGLVRGREAVFHAGAYLGADLAIARDVNVTATGDLVRAAAGAGVRRFVHVSSVAVYGRPKRLRVDETTPLAVDAPAAYPKSKARAELAARRAASDTELELALVRPTCVFGPGSQIWTVALAACVRAGVPVVVGDGSAPFSGIYVDDLVDLLLLASVRPLAADGALNATDAPVPWAEFAAGYAGPVGAAPGRLTRAEAEAVLEGAVPPPSGVPGAAYATILFVGLESARGLVIPASRARGLGWRPRVGIQAGLRRSVAWLRAEGLA